MPNATRLVTEENYPVKLSTQDAQRFWSKVKITTEDECWEWAAGTFGGYGAFWLKQANTNVKANRIAYIAEIGQIPTGMLVCHRCDNRKCCNPKHLFLGTVQDNTDDKINKGRQTKGEMQHLAKLTAETVIKMRAEHAAGADAATIGKRHGISHSASWMAVTGKTWKHIPMPQIRTDKPTTTFRNIAEKPATAPAPAKPRKGSR